jgi:hypothetical protein
MQPPHRGNWSTGRVQALTAGCRKEDIEFRSVLEHPLRTPQRRAPIFCRSSFARQPRPWRASIGRDVRLTPNVAPPSITRWTAFRSPINSELALKFAALSDGDITVHFSAHDRDFTSHVTANSPVLANCQNTVDRCNLAFQCSIKSQFVPKLDRTFDLYLSREVIFFRCIIFSIRALRRSRID